MSEERDRLYMAAALETLREEARTAIDRRNSRGGMGSGLPYVFQGCPPSCLRFIIATCTAALEGRDS